MFILFFTSVWYEKAPLAKQWVLKVVQIWDQRRLHDVLGNLSEMQLSGFTPDLLNQSSACRTVLISSQAL